MFDHLSCAAELSLVLLSGWGLFCPRAVLLGLSQGRERVVSSVRQDSVSCRFSKLELLLDCEREQLLRDC